MLFYCRQKINNNNNNKKVALLIQITGVDLGFFKGGYYGLENFDELQEAMKDQEGWKERSSMARVGTRP